MRPLPQLIFMSRWLQLPLYLGLIVAQGVYVWQFWVELVHLVEAAMGSEGRRSRQIVQQRDAGRRRDRQVAAGDARRCWSCSA